MNSKVAMECVKGVLDSNAFVVEKMKVCTPWRFVVFLRSLEGVMNKTLRIKNGRDEEESMGMKEEEDVMYRKMVKDAEKRRIVKCFMGPAGSPVNNYSSVSKGFQPKFTPKLIQSSSNSNNQADPKFQDKITKVGTRRMKAKLALLNGKSPKVSVKEEVTLVKRTDGSNLTRNWLNGSTSHKKEEVLVGELFTESSSKMNENENLFIPASMGRILVPESQAVNESLKPTKTLITPESSKDSEDKSLTPLPPLKNIQGASPSSKVIPLTFQPHSLKERPGGADYSHKKMKNQAKSDKTGHEMEKCVKTKPSQSQVNSEKKKKQRKI
ncbi:hypothetical protein Tco_0200556 [Tanacetum coccineum]